MSHFEGSPKQSRRGEAFKLLLISFEKDDLKGWDDSMDSFFCFFLHC